MIRAIQENPQSLLSQIGATQVLRRHDDNAGSRALTIAFFSFPNISVIVVGRSLDEKGSKKNLGEESRRVCPRRDS
jgi:hypothetical protein